MAVHIASLRPDDAYAVAAAAGLGPMWQADAVRAACVQPGMVLLAAWDANKQNDPQAICGAAWACYADVAAELYDIFVVPAARRRGIADALLQAVLAQLPARGCQSLLLEVAADNTAAQALYQKFGFVRCGTRVGYYARVGKPAQDAWLLRFTSRA